MVEAVFDFASINRRMNRKPELAYDPIMDEMVTPSELAARREARVNHFASMAAKHQWFDLFEKAGDMKIGQTLSIKLPKDFVVRDTVKLTSDQPLITYTVEE